MFETSETIWPRIAADQIATMQAKGPLVHNITNFVVMGITANVLLAQGAFPVMAHAPEEVEEMAGLAQAVVLNIGTLSQDWVDSMVKAGARANQLGTPVVLDPVGAGATRYRTDAVRRILERMKIAVLRGNPSEILAVSGARAGTRGVDAVHGVEEITGVARDLARNLNCIVAVSGPRDLVTDGQRCVRLSGGSPLMTQVTGMGCALSSTVGAFVGSAHAAGSWADHALAGTVGAFALYNAAGDMAAGKAFGPGSFEPAFLDALAAVGEAELLKADIREE